MHRRSLIAGASLALPALHAHAQSAWPSREIQLVTGFGPGGGTDVVARSIAAHMERTLGVSVIVRNTPGAGGTLGPARIAASRPDGYTFGLVGLSALVVAPLTMEVPYRPFESFDILGTTSELRIGFPVGPSMPNVRSIADFVAEARRRPVTFASTNPGSAVAMFEFQRLARFEMNYIQFGSITDAAAQVAGGHIDSYTGTPEMIGLVRAGNLRMLASASVDRWPEFPEVPTLIEQGFETATRQPIIWAGPTGLPAPIRERLAAALLAAARDPEVQARQNAASIASRVLDGTATSALIQQVRPGVEAAIRGSGVARRAG